VKDRGVRAGKKAGDLVAGRTRIVRIRLRPKKSGRSRVAFTVTSRDAGDRTVRKKIRVTK